MRLTMSKLSHKARRQKGARGEREFLGILRTILEDDTIQRNTLQTREGGADCQVPLGGTVLEIKRQEKTAFPSWLQQARDAAGDKIPALAWRKSNAPWRVLVELSPEQYAKLIKSKIYEEE